MRTSFSLLPLLLASAACGGPSPDREHSGSSPKTSYQSERAADESSESRVAPAAPAIAPTAAPGVAFNYRYAFRLPANRIAQVQEGHAQACEKLGIDRCRITGMLYRLVNDRDIEGQLSFKLDPGLARVFGKQGIEAVTRAAGMLVESEITGEDVGSRIASTTRSQGDVQSELEKVEQQLARAGLKSQERAELQARAGQLRDSLRSLKAGKADDQEALARTPVVYQYGSGDLAPGFDKGSPILRALENAWDNVIAGLATIIMILVTLLPWALVLLLGLWGWRRVSPRLMRREMAEVSEASAAS